MIITLELVWAVFVAFWPIWLMVIFFGPAFYFLSGFHADRVDRKKRKASERAMALRKRQIEKPLSKGWHKLDDLPMAKPKLTTKPKSFPMQGIAESHAEEMTMRRSSR